VAFRVMGPDPEKLRDIATQVRNVMLASPLMRTTNTDWGERVPTLRFALDQDRLQSIGLTSSDAAQQMQFLLSGVPITEVREDIRSVQVTARSAGNARLDPGRIADFTLVGAGGQRIPLSQIGTTEIRMEDPILRRRDRTPTITVRGDIAEGLQPPDVSTAVLKELQPIIAKLPAGYRIEEGGSIEESGKANRALAPLFPIMVVLTLITIILQVRSIPAMTMVFATAPLGLIGVIPTLLLFQQPFGINALVGLVALLAFIPLTHSVFWGTLAYTLIGGTFAGTVLTLVFLPALYAIWFKIKPAAREQSSAAALPASPPPCSSAVPAARSPFSIPACRAIASPATRMACSATITSHRWTSWPRRGSSWRVIPRSSWSVPGPTASPAPSTISPFSLAMAKALGRAA